MFVFDASDAQAFIVADSTGQLHIVETSDLEINPLKTIDRTRSFGELILNNVEGEPIQTTDESDEALRQVITVGRIMVAADTLGASQTMLNKAVEYAGERKQFNRVIGSFQAVKHMCSEMAAELEPCRRLFGTPLIALAPFPKNSS